MKDAIQIKGQYVCAGCGASATREKNFGGQTLFYCEVCYKNKATASRFVVSA
ncbi:MAG: hypothetical protein V1817_01940 [Candidatus Micrarchaeota archaeon]